MPYFQLLPCISVLAFTGQIKKYTVATFDCPKVLHIPYVKKVRDVNLTPYETVGKALFFNISALQSKLNMA